MRISEMGSQPKSTSKHKTVNETYDELKDCSSEELMQRLAKEISGQKLNGTFDYEGLKASVEQIKAYLPNQTYENMMRIIESFK